MAALRRVQKQLELLEEQPAAVTAGGASSTTEALQKALGGLLEEKKKEKEKPKLQLDKALGGLTLKHLDPVLWPKAAEGDELLVLVQKQKEKGVGQPFPYAELRKYLPTWCEAGRHTEESDDEPTETAAHLAKALGVPAKRHKPHLTLLQWVAAYDRFAVASAAAGLWSYTDALKHKDNCLRLSEEAKDKGKSATVGLVYDELARKRWAEYAYSGVEGFALGKACLAVDRDLAAQAENELEKRNNRKEHWSEKGKGKHKGWSSKEHDDSWKGKGKGNKGWNDDKSWGNDKRRLPWDAGYKHAKKGRA